MKVKAIRTDSWLGITTGDIYDAKVVKAMYGDVIMVYTDGYQIFFNENDFEIVTA